MAKNGGLVLGGVCSGTSCHETDAESESSDCKDRTGVVQLDTREVSSLIIRRSQRAKLQEIASQSEHGYTLFRNKSPKCHEVLNRSCSDIFADDFDHEPLAEQSLTADSSNVSVQRPEVPHYNEADIVLSESDVPGAKLPNPIVEENVVRDLKRWLYCHEQNVKGNKPVLIARIVKCMNSTKPPLVRRDADKGVWIRRKLDRLRMAYSIQCSQINFPEFGFEPFPSKDIPQTFNFGSVFHYLIESRPMLQCSSSSSDDSADEALEVVHEEIIKDPFVDPKCKGMLRVKLLRRGLQYVKSGWVKGLQDCSDGRYHYVKAHVRASMDPQAYWVYITISTITGGVCQATCGYPCPATANGRCSHVSAALLQILAHIHLNGYGSITCTSRPQEWGKGALQRNPSAIADRQYDSFKIDVKRRAQFDPRPTAVQGGPSTQQINDFLSALQFKEKPCYWQIHMFISYEDYAISLEDLWIFDENRWLYYESLEEQYSQSKPNPDYKGPFEFPGTQGQSKSVIWKTMRALNCTASSCKKICRMTSDKSITRFLRTHLWGLDPITSKACKYGICHEGKAREAYIQMKRAEDDTVQVFTTGLHVHTEYLGLACSLDGQVISDKSPPRNLEIKCPYTLRDEDPNNFEQVLTKKQMSNFCLTRNKSGLLELKPTHEYYYQIQMGMGLTECKSCDFFMWSSSGSILITVPFDENLWKEIRKKLALFHWETLVPEYFAMKTPRNLTAMNI